MTSGLKNKSTRRQNQSAKTADEKIQRCCAEKRYIQKNGTTTYEKPSTLKRRWLDLLIDVIEDVASIFNDRIIAQYAEKSMKIGVFSTPAVWKLMDGLVLQRTLWNRDPMPMQTRKQDCCGVHQGDSVFW
jgi:hypothetical protein